MIVSAELTDIDWIKEIWDDNLLNSNINNLIENIQFVKVIRPYAFIRYKNVHHGITICEVAVHPAHRRKGYASQLISSLFEFNIIVGAITEEACKMYRKLGFQDLGTNTLYDKTFTTFFRPRNCS